MAKTQTPTAFKAVWPDGSTTTARSATEFLLRLADAQWSPTTYAEMKEQLSRRAQAYPDGTGQFVHPSQPDEPFLRELHRVGMFDLWENGVKLPRG